MDPEILNQVRRKFTIYMKLDNNVMGWKCQFCEHFEESAVQILGIELADHMRACRGTH